MFQSCTKNGKISNPFFFYSDFDIFMKWNERTNIHTIVLIQGWSKQSCAELRFLKQNDNEMV